MKISLQKFVWCVALVLLLFAIEAECGDVTVRLFDLVLVSGESVCLGDLADLEGLDDAVNRLASTSIAVSDHGGSVMAITPIEIASRIPEGITLYFIGAPAVYVATGEESCDAALILPALQNRLNHLAGDSLTVSVKLDGTHSMLQGAESPPVRFSIHDLDAIYPGEQVITLIRRDGRCRVNRQHLKVKVTATAMLAFPVKMVKRGEAIKAGDIESRMTDLKSERLPGLVMDAESLEGLEASRLLSPGNPVRWVPAARSS
jgi:hypothetical protein